MKHLSREDLKKINGGFNPGCSPAGNVCLVNPNGSTSGVCCSGLVCIPDASLGNNAGRCSTSVPIS